VSSIYRPRPRPRFLIEGKSGCRIEKTLFLLKPPG
jgi:hypothetical protein